LLVPEIAGVFKGGLPWQVGNRRQRAWWIRRSDLVSSCLRRCAGIKGDTTAPSCACSGIWLLRGAACDSIPARRDRLRYRCPEAFRGLSRVTFTETPAG